MQQADPTVLSLRPGGGNRGGKSISSRFDSSSSSVFASADLPVFRPHGGSFSIKMTGNISYNGYNLKDIVPQKTSAYVSQNDLHIPEMTVRETLNFSACCQGIGSRAEITDEVSRKEKEEGIYPDPDINIFMKILGVDTCADVLVGNAMKRGISGGEKKRLTTGSDRCIKLSTILIKSDNNIYSQKLSEHKYNSTE